MTTIRQSKYKSAPHLGATTLMVQGTTSDAGKSLVASGLCRLLCMSGMRVYPFKPQNMSLNSAVAIDGGEVGRAQAVQALACRVPLEKHFNPVLLKPTTEKGAQVIVQGKAYKVMDARSYSQYKGKLMPFVVQSYQTLANKADVIIAEGAGSPAEINLRQDDLANMGFAEEIDCPVLLVADIERGGVFAQIAGTIELLSESERLRIKGILINRFRGDVEILKPGLDWVYERYKIPIVGIFPYMDDLYLDAEDSLARKQTTKKSARLRVGILAFPRMSNHTDFEALDQNPNVQIKYLKDPKEAQEIDLLILPGSKNVHDDLTWLRTNQWESAIMRHLRYGGKLLGICAGMQMLGEKILDPDGVESRVVGFQGLGLLELTTTLKENKLLRNVKGHLCDDVKTPMTGYEIHAGLSQGNSLMRPFCRHDFGCDGAISNDDCIRGTYVHGIFDHPEACLALLKWADMNEPESFDLDAHRHVQLDNLAKELFCCLEKNWLEGVLGLKPSSILPKEDARGAL